MEKDNKNENKETKDSNEINYKIPNEIVEKRKVSKSKKLQIKYNCIKTIKPYKVEMTYILFLKSSNIIVTSSLDPEIETWTFDSEDSNLKLLSILEGHLMSVHSQIMEYIQKTLSKNILYNFRLFFNMLL